jgi:hypothetical protein
MSSPFEALGRMSVASACMEIIRELDEGDGISKLVAREEVCARTEREVEDEAILRGMREASERLMDDGVPGAFAVRNSGWQRMKPADVVEYMRARNRRAAKQTRREYRSVDAVKDVAGLSWQDRETVRVVEENRRRSLEMRQRKLSRKRPIWAVEDGAAG